MALTGLPAHTGGSETNDMSTRIFVVTHSAGTGNESGNATAAFQSAIDACSAAGGGVVYASPGDYVLGRIFLKNNVTLELEAGAILRPSKDRSDYPAFTGSPDSHYKPEYGENAISCRYAIIYAYKAKNISVRGRGKILGEGKSFWKVKNTGDFEKWNTAVAWHYYTPNTFRPILILFEECENTLVTDIVLEDSPCYAGWFAGCRNMRFDGTTILNNLAGPNTDGYHFSSCRNVHIADCHFVCGDDCIAIDPNHDGPSANITIAGCTFNTSVNVFRIYTGLDPFLPKKMPRGEVSDIVAVNCSVEDASGVFNITAEGGDIARLDFTNFTINMEQRGSAFFLLTQKGGSIRDVVLRDMAIRTDGIGTISGEDGRTISGITLDDLRYGVYPRTKRFGNGMPDPLPNYALHHFAPYNLYIRHAQHIVVRDLRVDWRVADLTDLEKVPGSRSSWSCIECRDITQMDIDGASCPPYGNDAPAVSLTDATDVRITRCKVPKNTRVFLAVDGASSNIRLEGNNIPQGVKVYEMSKGVPQEALISDTAP